MTPRELIELVGGPVKLSKALGYRTHSAVLKWKEIPLGRVLDVERATGIPRHKLRPDHHLEPQPAEQAAA